MQRARRHNPYPPTWEIPFGVACLVLLTLTVGVHVGNGLAHLTAGTGWVWPTPAALFTSVPGILAVDPGPAAVSPHTWIITIELLLTGSLAGVATVIWQRWGPHRLKGMATADQADQVLGVRRLRKVAAIIRPDLHAHRSPAGGRR